MERIDLFKAYFTEESKYYADKLCKFEEGKKYSFNFWAGFLGIIWFCYRRMYLQGFMVLISTFILIGLTGILIAIIGPDNESFFQDNRILIEVIIWTLSFVVVGFTGNILYIKKSRKIVAEFISKRGLENIDNSMPNDLREKGGTSLTDALICSGMLTVINIVLKFIA